MIDKINLYFLVDISGSMIGEPINSVNRVIRLIINKLDKDFHCNERINISLNTYNRIFFENYKLQNIKDFNLNFKNIENTDGPTHTGMALEKILKIINISNQNNKYSFGYFKSPIIIHITDGRPSDIQFFEEMNKVIKQHKINTIACGIGKNIDTYYLDLFSNKVNILEKYDIKSIEKFSAMIHENILFYLNSNDDGLDSLNVINPDNPINPILNNKIKIN